MSNLSFDFEKNRMWTSPTISFFWTKIEPNTKKHFLPVVSILDICWSLKNFQKYIDLYCKEVVKFLTTVMCVQFGWGSSSKCRWEWIFLGDPAMSYKTRWDLESPLVYCLWYQEFPTPKGAIDKIHIFGPENQKSLIHT